MAIQTGFTFVLSLWDIIIGLFLLFTITASLNKVKDSNKRIQAVLDYVTMNGEKKQ